MNSYEGANSVYLVLLLLLVMSSLIASRLPLGKALKIKTAWPGTNLRL